MACTACGSILNGIYKHAPMTREQVDDSRNRDREIVVITDPDLFGSATKAPSSIKNLLAALHIDAVPEPMRFTPAFEMTSDANDSDRRHLVTWEMMYAMRNSFGGLRYLKDGGINVDGDEVTLAETVGSLRSFNGGEESTKGELNTGCITPIGSEGKFSVSLGLNSSVTGNYSTIAGGGDELVSGNNGNKISSNGSFIGAGSNNSISSVYFGCFIGAGEGNMVSGTSRHGSIVSGNACVINNSNEGFIGNGLNLKLVNSNQSLIVGGTGNEILTAANSGIFGGYENKLNYATACGIVSGKENTISGLRSGDVVYSIICSGLGNKMSCDGSDMISESAIICGRNNSVLSKSISCSIVSGESNEIESVTSIICSGYKNNIDGSTNSALSTGSFIGAGNFNKISNQLSFIGSGYVNSISSVRASICAGSNNSISSVYVGCFIGAGDTNKISGESSSAAIISGTKNNIDNSNDAFIGGGNTVYIIDSDQSLIIGGSHNTLNYVYASVIGGGSSNSIIGGFGDHYNITDSFIGAGRDNKIRCDTGSMVATASILGGRENYITNTSTSLGISDSSIVSGASNTLGSDASIICGGINNTISGAANTGVHAPRGDYSFIGAGLDNVINKSRSFIGGGEGNTTNGEYSFIGGGKSNTTWGGYSFVGSGYCNVIGTASTTQNLYAVIAGGTSNKITSGNPWGAGVLCGVANHITGNNGQCSLIIGGRGNSIANDQASIIGGGGDNKIEPAYITSMASGSVVFGSDGSYNAIVGGYQNNVRGSYSSILGGTTNAIRNVDSGESQSTAVSSNAVICGGTSNVIRGQHNNSGIFCGQGNQILRAITAGSSESSILTGSSNIIMGSTGAVILSGVNNYIESSDNSIIASGYINSIVRSTQSIICGGGGEGNPNYIQPLDGSSIANSFIGTPSMSIIHSSNSFIGVGNKNYINSDNSFIGGGSDNFIENLSPNHDGFSAILMGKSNLIEAASNSTIVCGKSNAISYRSSVLQTKYLRPDIENDFIGGGYSNYIADANNSAIVAGSENKIYSTVGNVFIGSGSNNSIYSGVDYSFIGSGVGNYIRSGAVRSGIVSGSNNSISDQSDYKLPDNTLVAVGSIIGGGYGNTINTGSAGNVIGGGYGNLIQYGSYFSSIFSGVDNAISDTNIGCIVSGSHNSIHGYITNGDTKYNLDPIGSIICGGVSNSISVGSNYIVNYIPPKYSSIVGGEANQLMASYSTIIGSDHCVINNNGENDGYNTLIGCKTVSIPTNYSSVTVIGCIGIDATKFNSDVGKSNTTVLQSLNIHDGKLRIPGGVPTVGQTLIVDSVGASNYAALKWGKAQIDMTPETLIYSANNQTLYIDDADGDINKCVYTLNVGSFSSCYVDFTSGDAYPIGSVVYITTLGTSSVTARYDASYTIVIAACRAVAFIKISNSLDNVWLPLGLGA